MNRPMKQREKETEKNRFVKGRTEIGEEEKNEDGKMRQSCEGEVKEKIQRQKTEQR